jgi:hypothetical protein
MADLPREFEWVAKRRKACESRLGSLLEEESFNMSSGR